MSKKPDPTKEDVYSGVRSGPYLKYYQEWLATEEGQRIEAAKTDTKIKWIGELDLLIDLYTVGIPSKVVDTKFILLPNQDRPISLEVRK